MNGYTLTKVFEINNRLVVADTIEEAIGVYKLRTPDMEVRNISQIGISGVVKDYDALIAEPIVCSCRGWELTHITFTGVDERTDIGRLCDIQQRYPKVEFGVLLSRKWQENGQRYPSPEKVEELRGRGLRLSAHLCGSLARDVMSTGGFANVENPFGSLLHIFRRVQLNVSAYAEAQPTILVPGSLEEIIIQQADSRTLFEQCYIANGEHIAMLLDKSGGLGIDTPIEVPPYAYRVHVGFAGGFNPDNVIDKLHAITASDNVGRFWIDMESGVRTDDWLDLDKVEEVCAKVYDEFLSERV